VPRLGSHSWKWWTLQVVLIVAVLALLGRSLARHWDEFRAVQFPVRLHAGWIGLAALVVLLTYAVLIAAWKAVIAQGHRLPYLRAVRVWTLSNLGRYLPGKIWSVAGLAVLAAREGIPGWAAVAAAVAMQAIALGSGVAVVAAAVPGSLAGARLAGAAAVAVLTIVMLVSPAAVALTGRLIRRDDLRALPVASVAFAGAATALAWVGYGVAFWCLARGTLGVTTLHLGTATGVFAAGYLAGLLAFFAPGGVGVRELVLIPLLTPSAGPGGAIVLTIASRILLTLTEGLAAFVGLALGGPPAASAPSPPRPDDARSD